jgi:RHS repeat-associated protein
LSAVVNPAALRLTYAYDAASRRKYLVEPEGSRFSYAYDAAGRTSFLTNPQGQRTSWSYDAASRVTGIRFANTTRSSYSYDKTDRLLRVANVTSTSTTLSSFAYAYDAEGNRTRVVEANGDRVTWSYDNTYQLKNERRSGANAYNITYTYDPVGNRVVQINGGARTTNTYDAANELVKSQAAGGTTTYTYDPAGNQLVTINPSNQRTTNTWDFENRLTKVVIPSGVRNTFSYNGDGQRVQKQDSTGTAKHVWDGQYILLETDGGNIVQTVYTCEPSAYGNLISQRRGGTTSFYLFDALGSTRQLSNSTGTVTDGYVYDSFGNILLVSGTTTNYFRYIGQSGYYFDVDLAKYYLRARIYDPTSGQFLSRDPLATTRTRMTIVYYIYVSNCPISLTDPSGLWQLRCRGLAGIASLSRQWHCWVECLGHSYSLLNKGGTATPSYDDPADLGKGWVMESGIDRCDCLQCNFIAESGTYPYDPNDCNSNWYANSLLRSCKIFAERPRNAWGWDSCKRYKFQPPDNPFQ